MSALISPRPKRFYLRGTVACPKCETPIHIYKLGGLHAEFSVRCTRCNTRSLYSKGALTVEELPERRRKPRPE